MRALRSVELEKGWQTPGKHQQLRRGMVKETKKVDWEGGFWKEEKTWASVVLQEPSNRAFQGESGQPG